MLPMLLMLLMLPMLMYVCVCVNAAYAAHAAYAAYADEAIYTVVAWGGFFPPMGIWLWVLYILLGTILFLNRGSIPKSCFLFSRFSHQKGAIWSVVDVNMTIFEDKSSRIRFSRSRRPETPRNRIFRLESFALSVCLPVCVCVWYMYWYMHWCVYGRICM